MKTLGIHIVGALLLISGLLSQTVVAQTADNEALTVEQLKQKVIELNRDLLILEEDLLFPASAQISVFVSMDTGEYFQLDSIKLELNGKVVASHLYTEREIIALKKGGIQRLYLGNVKTGDHRVYAVFTGKGPNNREYKRAVEVTVEKD